jgi:peptidoglycan/LPS O-acetylase OafA/YrhL
VTLGTFSYSLYLVHTLVQPFVDVGMRRVGLTGELYVINFFAQIVVSVIAGWLFFLAVERHFLGKGAQHNPNTKRRTTHFERAPLSPDRLCA